MKVPLQEILCRFIRPDDWSDAESRPRASAFKFNKRTLSAWSVTKLEENDVEMVELQIEEFYDSRQAHCKAEDYLIIVEKVKEKFAFCIQIVWRPDDIKEPWEKWAYAHINLEITKDLDDKSGEKEFRRALSMADIFTFDPT